MSFLDLCEKYFGRRNLYEAFNIEKNASEKEVRKAYHKMSLIYHPDRVDEGMKIEATEKFKILGKIHSILSDKEKRALFDESGTCSWEEDDEINFEGNDWMEYWQKINKNITLSDIEKYEKQYKGSDEELEDVKRAYSQWKGDMDMIYAFIPFLTLDEEDRVRARIQELIDSGELPSYELFTNEPQRKRDRRVRQLRKEEKETAKLEKEKKNSELTDLAKAIMQRRQQSTDNFLTALEKKYSSPKVQKKNGRGRKSNTF